MKKHLVGLVAALGTSVVCSSASAGALAEAWFKKSVLAKADDMALDAGKGILTDVGKGLLGSVLNSYAPGLGSLLGLTAKENTGTKEIIAAIAADGTRTRDLVLQFWDWAVEVDGVALQNNFDSVEKQVIAWNKMDPKLRVANRERLYVLVPDCLAVLAAYKSGVTALDRVKHLDGYLTLLSLTIPLAAELEELDYIGGESGAQSGDALIAWWASKTQGERDVIAAEIDRIRRTTVADLLLSGLGISFEDYVAEMDIQGDFVAARDEMFSPLEGTADVWATGWTYYFGLDDTGNCRQEGEECHKFTIKSLGQSYACNPGHLTGLYQVDFENGGRKCYNSAQEAYEEHKALALKDMVRRLYGPVRLMAEELWRTWGFGLPNRLTLDDTIEGYINESAGGVVERLATQQTFNWMTREEKTYVYSFALAQGLNAIHYISQEAQAAVDWLDEFNPSILCDGSCVYINLTRYPADMHLSAMRAWPMSVYELESHYRGLPTAKFATLTAPLI